MQATDQNAVVIDVSFNASVSDVWRAWTNAAIIAKWFGSDPNGEVLAAELEVCVSGSFKITFKDSDQTEHTCFGVYKKVEEFSKLAFTWAWKDEPGVESLVTVLIYPNGNTTSMHFEHAHLGNASMHNYLQGWNATFLKLKRVLAEQQK